MNAHCRQRSTSVVVIFILLFMCSDECRFIGRQVLMVLVKYIAKNGTGSSTNVLKC